MLSGASLVAVAFAGCGSSHSTTAASSAQPSGGSEVAASARCTSQRNDVDVQVTIYAGGTAACVVWNNQAARSSGRRWHLTSAVLHAAPVCSLARSASVIEVREGGSAEQGQEICSNLKSKTWTEVEGPGERAEKAAQQHKAP
jgi:hypothetical protein